MLPESIKQTIWILLGAVYPILSSIVVMTTIDGGELQCTSMQEMLIRRDAEMLKRQVLANIPPERQKLVLNDIATSLEDIDAKVSTFNPDYNTMV